MPPKTSGAEVLEQWRRFISQHHCIPLENDGDGHALARRTRRAVDAGHLSAEQLAELRTMREVRPAMHGRMSQQREGVNTVPTCSSSTPVNSDVLVASPGKRLRSKCSPAAAAQPHSLVPGPAGHDGLPRDSPGKRLRSKTSLAAVCDHPAPHHRMLVEDVRAYGTLWSLPNGM